MKKRLIILFTAIVCLICCAFALSACGGPDGASGGGSGDSGGDEYVKGTEGLLYSQSVLSDGTVTYICQGIGTATAADITIASHIDGKPVTSIGKSAFRDCTSIESITIPNTVTSIGGEAFHNCTSLKSVTIGNGVTSIGRWAFLTCTSLTGVYITDVAAWCNIEFDSYNDNPLNCAHNLYLNNVPLTELTADMLQGVTEIKEYAFYGCQNLTSVAIPDSVASVSNRAFKDCTNIKTATIPAEAIHAIPKDNLETAVITSGASIDESAFRNCSNLKNITIANTVTSIGKEAFKGCTSLKNIAIPAGVTSIGSEAFNNCTGLTGVYITDMAAWCNIDFGGDYAANPLYYAHNLYLNNELVTEITADMLQGATEIKAYAFYDCTNLTSVAIPDSVTSVSSMAFYNCTNIKTATIPAEAIGAIPKDNLETAVITSGASIGGNAFYKATRLTSITIPASVTSIGAGAFSDCTNLTEVYITDLKAWCNIKFGSYNANPLVYAHNFYLNGTPVTEITGDTLQGITGIKDYAFYNCASLTSITIPASVTSIGSDAFNGCTGLAGVYVTDLKGWCNISFGNIAANPLNYAHNLYSENELVEELNIPNELTEIKQFAFCGCESITSVTIPDSVTSIGSDAFYNCTNLKNATIPALAISAIPKDNLETVVITSGTSINYRAFYKCTSLINITIPDSVTSIGNDAFYTCTNIKTAAIPAWALPRVPKSNLQSLTVTSGDIADRALYNCESLESVTIGDGVTSIDNNAFYGCTSLTDITIGENIDFIGENAFYNTAHYNSNDNWQNGVLYIDNYLIKVNTLSGSYSINDGTIGIAVNAFQGISFSKLSMPAGIRFIGSNAFLNCSLSGVYITDLKDWCNISFGNYAANPLNYAHNLYLENELVEELNIPNELTEIKQFAFFGCESITSVTIPKGITSIGEDAFANCTKLNAVYISDIAAWCNIDFGGDYAGANPLTYAYNLYLNNELVTEITADMLQGVTEIKRIAFYYCMSLESVTLPNSVTSIGDSAFSGCINITSLTLNNVSHIGNYAFSSCTSLTSITIPENVENIGSNSFGGCYKLVEVINLSGLDVQQGKESNGYVAYYALNVVDSATKSKIQTTEDGYEFYVGDEAVYLIRYKGNQTELNLPDNLNERDYEIYKYAFYGNVKMASITIPDCVTSIGDFAFYGCSGLLHLNFGESSKLKTIGRDAFWYCAFTELTIPDSVTSIDDYAFHRCNIISAKIPTIAIRALPKDNLETVVITSGTQISGQAFRDCKKLRSVVIAESVTSIGGHVFDGCKALSSVTFNNTAGWKVSKNSDMSAAESINVSSSQKNALYLRSTYLDYYWRCYKK